MRACPAVLAIATLFATGCPTPRADPLTHWLRVGADPRADALVVIASLERAGYTLRQRVEAERFVALAFVRAHDERRAVRVLTRLGVAASLDSHETDGVRVRHGAVRLLELDEASRDLDGDGHAELLLARDGDTTPCLAVLRVDADGRARAMPIESESIAPAACPTRARDVDGDGRAELLVELAWPELALDAGEVPRATVPLFAREGAFRAEALPSALVETERVRLRRELEEARAALDVARASRVGVEQAALAALTGAAASAQIARYDDALAGLALSLRQRDLVLAVRAYLAAGWSARRS